MAKDKLEGKPRTVGSAQKAGEKYFYDKNGTKKLAVTAEELKKSGKSLKQWANDWKKPEKKPLRPKTRKAPPKKAPPKITKKVTPKRSGRPNPSTAYKSGEKAGGGRRSDYAISPKKETPSSDRGKSRTVKRIREPGGVDPMGLAGPKTYKPRPRKGSFDPNKLATPLKSFSFKQWSSMSEAERRKLRLPLKNYPGGKNFRVVQKPMSVTK
tara:strand:+ start:87 stop:719 length:633 start_codon:yes stop_codon:yes gene_type:complete